jgi:hypothetical protein
MINLQSEEFDRKIDAGIKIAIAEAIEVHRRMGRSIVVLMDGKITRLSPSEIPPLHSNGEEAKPQTA